MRYMLNGVFIDTSSGFNSNYGSCGADFWSNCTKEDRVNHGIVDVIDVYPPLTPYTKYNGVTDTYDAETRTRTITNVVVLKTNEELDADLEAMRVIKKAEFTATSLAATYANVTYMGHAFQADADSAARVIQVLSGLSYVSVTPPGFYWVAADNSHVNMTYEQVQGLALAMLNQGLVAFQRLQTAKLALDAVNQISLIDTVVY